MKTSRNLGIGLRLSTRHLPTSSLLAAALVFSVGAAQAQQEQFWAGGDGKWSDLKWSPPNDGVGPRDQAWTADNLPTFDVTEDGTVTVVGTESVGIIGFDVDGYTITGGTLTMTHSAGNINASANAAHISTIDSVLAGTTGLTKSRAGTISLTGMNIYSGNTNINAGTLRAVDGVGLPSGSHLVFNLGAFESSGTFTRANTPTAGTGTFTNVSNRNTIFSAHGGKLIITVGDDPTIEQTIRGSDISADNQFRELNFGRPNANAEVKFRNNISLHNGLRVVDVTTGDGTGNFFATLSGVIRDGDGVDGDGVTIPGGIDKQGAGKLVLTGLNTYTGVTNTGTSGNLEFNSIANAGVASSFGAYATVDPDGLVLGTSAHNVLGTSTLKYTGSVDGSTNRGFRNTANVNIDVNGHKLTFGDVTIGNGNVTAVSSTAAGTLILGNVTLTAPKNINTTTGNAECNNFTMGAFNTIFDTHNTGIGTTVKGVVSGSGNVTKSGNGVGGYLKLQGANTYTGQTFIQRGFLYASSLNNLGSGGLTPLASSSLGAPTNIANGTIKMGHSADYAPTLVYLGTGETTDRVINLNSTTRGATLDQSGTGLLKFTSWTGTANAFTVTGAGNKTLTLQGSTAGTGDIAAIIPDFDATRKTSLTKAGTGTWTLSGTNTYTGVTNVNAGTLLVNGSLDAASAVSVGASGTLGGSGTVGGNTTLSGILSPGTSPGTLTFGGDLTVNDGSTYLFDAEDLTVVNGTLILNDNWTLCLGSGFQNGGQVTIFTYGTLGSSTDLEPTFDFTNLDFTPSGDLSLTDTGNSIVLNGVSVIPEPGAAQ